MELPTLAVATKRAEKTFDLSKVLLFGPSIFAIVVAFIVAGVVVWPKYQEVQQLKISNKTLEETAVKLESKAAALSALDKEKLRSQLVAADQLLPSEKGIFTFIRQIENVRTNSGVIINNLSVGSVGQFSSGSGEPAEAGTTGSATAPAPAPPPTAQGTPGQVELGDVQTVTAKVTISSDFDQIFSFLNQLYGLPRVTSVSGLTFAQDQRGLISTTMDITSLWQELPTQLPSVETPLPDLSSAEIELLAKVQSESSISPPVVVPDVPKNKANIFATN